MSAIQFCPNCNNMLYPREDRANRQLVFHCRHCGYSDTALTEQQCVYRHIITHTAMDQTVVRVDLSNDPTYPRVRTECPNCGFDEAVFFMSKAKGPDTTMQLYFACCSDQCSHRWTVDVRSGAQGPSAYAG